MRPKPVVVLLAALCAFFGAMAAASAATTATPASTAYAQVAQVGTWAAVAGAPFCDDRAASEPAAEPTPREVDGGTVTSREPPCRSEAWGKGPAPTPTRDDLQRSPPTARVVALVPDFSLGSLSSSASARVSDRDVDDGARDGFDRRESPPPRR